MIAVRYLADTSVLLDFFGHRVNPQSDLLESTLRERQLVGICGQVLQESLQGARNAAGFEAMRARLVRLPMFEPADIYSSSVAAALTYARLRWQGITIRSTADCLIAQIAIEHKLTLLHDDDDFVQIAKIESRLKLA